MEKRAATELILGVCWREGKKEEEATVKKRKHKENKNEKDKTQLKPDR